MHQFGTQGPAVSGLLLPTVSLRTGLLLWGVAALSRSPNHVGNGAAAEPISQAMSFNTVCHVARALLLAIVPSKYNLVGPTALVWERAGGWGAIPRAALLKHGPGWAASGTQVLVRRSVWAPCPAHPTRISFHSILRGLGHIEA